MLERIVYACAVHRIISVLLPRIFFCFRAEPMHDILPVRRIKRLTFVSVIAGGND